MKKSIGVVLISLPLFLTACEKASQNTKNLYVPTSSDVTSNATLSELQQGRVLYVNNCGDCHGLYSPDSYSSSQWNSVMNSMAPKTNLSTSEVNLVKKYLSRGK
jgi:mono/diheme cytochrome c family protein